MNDRPRYRNGVLVYTAKDIHDDVRDGMDPDCLFVGLEAERDKWRNAVIDAAVVNWTYTKEDEEDPYRAVCKLLACAAREALDPLISLEAKALHDRIAELTADRDEWEKRCKRLIGVLSVYGLSPQAVAMIAEGSMEAENDWRRTL